MPIKRFSSQREEVLDYAFRAREAIRVGGDKINLLSILRSCATIADRLGSEEQTWISNELFYYVGKIPGYGRWRCRYQIEGEEEEEDEPRLFSICDGLSDLIERSRGKKLIRLKMNKRVTALVPTYVINRIMFYVTEKCRVFLDKVIKDVQYAGTVEYLMNEIRLNVDKKLGQMDRTISEELESIPVNLSSPNSTDWTKVGHSCRRILRFVADEVFPSQKEEYAMKDSTTTLKVGSEEFINRLCAFIDGKRSGDTRKFVVAEMNYLRKYLDRVAELARKDEHGKKIEKIDANMAAIHTYLVISEVLKFKE